MSYRCSGKVKRFLADKGFGFIVVTEAPSEDIPEQVFFHQSVVQKSGFADAPRDGQAVEFEAAPNPRRRGDWQVEKFLTIDGLRPGEAPARPKVGGFLNPYNFAGWGLGAAPTSGLLARTEPAGHDAFKGRSGRIVCRLTARSPLFTPDRRKRAVLPSDHKELGYFTFDEVDDWRAGGDYRDQTRPALPGSTLRGMVRSVFETVTESCWSIFDGRGLDYRAAYHLGLVPVRVVTMPREGEMGLVEILDASKGGPGSDPNIMSAGWAHAYAPTVGRLRDDPGIISPPSLADGSEVAAVIGKFPERHGRRPFSYYRCAKVIPLDEHQPLKAGSHEEIVFGYLHRTGPNIRNKHDERVFFRWNGPWMKQGDWGEKVRAFRAEAAAPPSGVQGDLPRAAAASWKESLEAYWDRHRRDKNVTSPPRVPFEGMRDAKLPCLSDFIWKSGHSLESGTLAYAWLENNAGRQVVRDLYPVLMPRLHHPDTRADLLPRHLHTCDFKGSERKLCPACRVFGWVRNDPEGGRLEQEDGRTDRIAGHVRFSHGNLIGPWDAERARATTERVTLSILGEPKPTTTAFYVQSTDGYPAQRASRSPRPAELKKVPFPLYDRREGTLAGRKVYRRHAWQDGQALNAPGCEVQGPGQSNQNSTVTLLREVSGPELTPLEFQFEIDFDNLTDAELGALLWSIELGRERNAVQRLGMGKALGLGMCEVRVAELQLVDRDQAYRSWSGDEGIETVGYDGPDGFAQRFVGEFTRAWTDLGLNTLSESRPVAHLLILLASDWGNTPVHYPREAPIRDEEGMNYKWFVHYRRVRTMLEEAEGELPAPEDEADGHSLRYLRP